MKSIFDRVSYECSRNVTKAYSTSFSTAVRMLAPSIRQDIHNIYGFVRLADEIVDSFHDYDKETLFGLFERDLESCLKDGISLNPILNAFQHTVKKHDIPNHLIAAFMKSMRQDLTKSVYNSHAEYAEYIYGSADVVGLMCLMVFVQGNEQQYLLLKDSAVRLGSAFQKVNFLRDIKADYELLNRSYFPGTDLSCLDEASKAAIVKEIEDDFAVAYSGIINLPMEAKFGVYTAYVYYRRLLSKLKKTPSSQIIHTRIRVPSYEKIGLFAKSYLTYRLNII